MFGDNPEFSFGFYFFAASENTLRPLVACLLRCDPYIEFTSGAPATFQSAPIKVWS